MATGIIQSISSNNDQSSKQEEQISQVEPLELGTISDSPESKSEHEAPAASTADERDLPASPTSQHLEGWKLYTLVFGLCLSLLLSTLETTIVSTSLVSITNALQGFENRDWIVTSYLLTYTGFLVIYAKFSDIFGAKFMILLALLLFTIFSIACGAATGMTELIVLRAFQGIGGSGIYSMVGVITIIVVPPEKYGKYVAIISSVFAVASVLGPVLGGTINDHSSWRWVFLLNAPGGAAASLFIVVLLPSDYSAQPNHSSNLLSRFRSRFTLASFRRLDLIGVVLMLAASILLVFSLEEAGTRYAWSSAAILCTLVVAVICWVAFVGWEMHLQKKRRTWRAEPIFPMSLLRDRVLVGMLLNAFLTGIPFTTLVVTLPQRFQAINSVSPTRAGLLLLPLLLISPFASALSALLTSSLHIPPLYLIISGSCLQFLGVGLMCSLSPEPTARVEPKQYVFEVIMGLGFGLVLTSLLTLIPLVVSKKDMPVIGGAITQVRVLGGTIGLALSTTILNSYVKEKLKEQLSAEQIASIAQSLKEIGGLGEEEQLFVRSTFGMGYARQLRVVAGCSGLVVLSSLLMVERRPRRHEVRGEGQGEVVDGT